jgi:hypothetical protein
MGARTNFHFKTNEDTLTLYSHWGGEERKKDLARAMYAALPRKGDKPYALRIMVSQLIGTSWDEETGYGLFLNEPAGAEESYGYLEINLDTWTVNDDGNVVSIEHFIRYNSDFLTLPKKYLTSVTATGIIE